MSEDIIEIVDEIWKMMSDFHDEFHKFFNFLFQKRKEIKEYIKSDRKDFLKNL